MIRPASIIGAALGAVLLAGCSVDETSEEAGPGERPRRIVSLDYCADQYVLKLADRGDILALSPDAEADFSYLRAEAAGLPTVRATAEDVLLLKPDLVVRSYGGGPNAKAFFERAGVPVLQVGWASSIDGESVGGIPAIIAHMAEGMGVAERGRAVIADYEDRLAAVRRLAAAGDAAERRAALYMTPAGFTTGSGSLTHEMIETAGLANFQTLSGWRSLPLERLAYERPDRVAAAYFDTRTNHPNSWSAARHPVAKAQMRDLPVTKLKGAWLACGGWFFMNALEALAADVAGDPGAGEEGGAVIAEGVPGAADE